MLWLDDAHVAGCGDENVDGFDNRFELGNLVAVHCCLQGADWVDFANDYAGTLTCHGFGRTLAHIAVSSDEHGLAADENVGGTVDAVW